MFLVVVSFYLCCVKINLFQAFLWWSTFGGCFGLGWLRDFFRIPAYVADSTTADEPFHPPFPHPPLSWTRSLAQAAIGYFFGLLIRLAVPDEILDEYFVLKVNQCKENQSVLVYD